MYQNLPPPEFAEKLLKNIRFCIAGRSFCTRVRTILVLGYWVLGNIHRHWAVLVIGEYFLLF